MAGVAAAMDEGPCEIEISSEEDEVHDSDIDEGEEEEEEEEEENRRARMGQRTFTASEKRACGALTVEEERHALLARAHLALAAKCREEQLRQSDAGSKVALQARQSYDDSWKELCQEICQASSDASSDMDLAQVALSVPDQHSDPSLVVQASTTWRLGLSSLCDEILDNRDTVLEIVKANGLALEFASPELQNDREVVLAAVSSHCWALQDVSMKMLEDREIVLAALRSQTRDNVRDAGENVLAYAARDLRADMEILLEAVRVDGRAVSLASFELRMDKDFLLQAMRRAPILEEDLCWDAALSSLREAVPLEDFQGASDSVLAIAGDSAPVLSIILKRQNLENNNLRVGSCEVSLLSGASFTCSLCNSGDCTEEPAQKRPRTAIGREETPAATAEDSSEVSILPQLCETVAELAAKLVLTELPRHVQMDPLPERIFMVFVKSLTDDEAVAATPWDWDRPLSDFL